MAPSTEQGNAVPAVAVSVIAVAKDLPGNSGEMTWQRNQQTNTFYQFHAKRPI